jgi:transcriptional regulator with XRE-family HTH domain
MTNYGVVLRKLRELNQLPIKQAAKVVGRSAGWLSEIENDRGEARIGLEEFERIVAAYGGQKHRDKFKIWIANAHKPEKANVALSFDGAILKYLREKADLSIEAAAASNRISSGYLSKLENGLKPVSMTMRNRLLQAYGYSPGSYRNFTSEDKRAKNIPTRYKLNILLTQMSEDLIEQVFSFAKQNLNSQGR